MSEILTFVITKEQLESLVELSQNKDVAMVIANEVYTHKAIPPVPILPRNPNHDGTGTNGLKRIYKWLGWEMEYNNFFATKGGCHDLEKLVRSHIVAREPTAFDDGTEHW